MINVTEKTKIYIFAPANTSTGGPECLHQLGSGLKELGFNVFMYYIPNNNPAPIHKEYIHYNIPFVDKIEDSSENIIIVPELYNFIILLNNYQNLQKIIWWLSIDNFYGSYYFNKRKIIGLIIWVINILTKKIVGKNIIDYPKIALGIKIDFNFIKALNVSVHLAQSEYSKKHLENQGIQNIEYLFDYIENGSNIDYNKSNKENIVLYNPAKGVIFTKKIISKTPDIKFVPIQKMSHAEVIEVMKKSKVYIDFGNHPGRDKMPREAALCGCCIITGKRGSALFSKDIDIPEKYKFDENNESIEKIIYTIKDCVNNYNTNINEFETYKEDLKKGQINFMEQLKKVFHF